MPLSVGGTVSLVDEAVTAALVMLWLQLGLFTARYLGKVHREHGPLWRQLWRVEYAVAFGVVTVGEWTRNLWRLYAQHGAATGWWSVEWMTRGPWRLVPLLATIVTASGVFCAMRTVVPTEKEGSSRHAWLGHAIVVVAFVLVVTFVR